MEIFQKLYTGRSEDHSTLPNGSCELISHKKVSHAEKTLGAMTSPDGNSMVSIAMMQEKAQKWINAVRNGHLHRQYVLFSLKVQFWL